MTTPTRAASAPVIAFAAIALIVSAVAVWLGWQGSRSNATLLDRGVVTTGAVTELQRRDAIRGSDDFVVLYRYLDDRAGSHAGEMSVSHKTWEGLAVGAPIPITYLVENPSDHVTTHLTSMSARQPLVSSLRFAGGTLGVTLLAGILGLLAVRRQNRSAQTSS